MSARKKNQYHIDFKSLQEFFIYQAVCLSTARSDVTERQWYDFYPIARARASRHLLARQQHIFPAAVLIRNSEEVTFGRTRKPRQNSSVRHYLGR